MVYISHLSEKHYAVPCELKIHYDRKVGTSV